MDGTLVPLAFRPFWYEQSYFDRKCQYSLNIQVLFVIHVPLPKETLMAEPSFQQIVSLPNLQIIDCGFGFVGSTHDTTAWEGTQTHKRHRELFDEDEFVWADSAYPVRF